MDHGSGPFRDWLDADRVAHPDSPAGGAGPGAARLPSALTAADPRGGFLHPDSPSGRMAIADGGQHSGTPAHGAEWARLLPQIDSVTETHAEGLRNSLSDASLRDAFEIHAGYVGLRYRRAVLTAHQAETGENILQRLQDLIEWVDPGQFGGLAGNRALREVFAPTTAAHGPRPTLAAITTLIEGLFAQAVARAAERRTAAQAAGPRDEYALRHTWLRRFAVYASELHARPRAETRQAVKRSTPSQLAGPPPEQTTKTWVEFQLVDLKGQPVTGQSYEVTLPDGSRHTGTTNARGKLRFDHIDPGQCQIRFLDLDGRQQRPA